MIEKTLTPEQQRVAEARRQNLARARAVAAERRLDRAQAEGEAHHAASRTEPSQARSGTRGQYYGRDGEVLTRNVSVGHDQFEIPAHVKEPGWSYVWGTERVYGDTDITKRHNHTFYQAGWRPVMATGRFNGVFGPPAYTGHVTLGDSGLYERPEEMTREAQIEDEKRARAQMSDRDQSLMGGKANMRALPPGMEMSDRYRGTGANLRMSIDPALDVPAPKHQIADDN